MTLAELLPLSEEEELAAAQAVVSRRELRRRATAYKAFKAAVREHFGEEHEHIVLSTGGRVLVGLPSRKANVELPPEIVALYADWRR